jgi:hypothetical protein
MRRTAVRVATAARGNNSDADPLLTRAPAGRSSPGAAHRDSPSRLRDRARYLEFFRPEIRNRFAALVDDVHVDNHDVDARLERRRLAEGDECRQQPEGQDSHHE